jgi:hypothetical protein
MDTQIILERLEKRREFWCGNRFNVAIFKDRRRIGWNWLDVMVTSVFAALSHRGKEKVLVLAVCVSKIQTLKRDNTVTCTSD